MYNNFICWHKLFIYVHYFHRNLIYGKFDGAVMLTSTQLSSYLHCFCHALVTTSVSSYDSVDLFCFVFFNSVVMILCQVRPGWQEGHEGLSSGNWDSPSGLEFLHHSVFHRTWAKQHHQLSMCWTSFLPFDSHSWRTLKRGLYLTWATKDIKGVESRSVTMAAACTVQQGVDESGLIFTHSSRTGVCKLRL